MAQKQFPTPAVPLTEHPASLPTAAIPDDVDHVAIASSGLKLLIQLSENDLTDNAIWRDTFALTGTMRTFYGPELVHRVWHELGKKHLPTNYAIVSSRIVRLGPQTCWVEANFSFNIEGERPAKCSGVIGFVPHGEGSVEHAQWKLWLLCTILEQPDGFPNVDDLRPVHRDHNFPNGLSNGIANGHHQIPKKLDCLVVGGSMAGLSMAGRLQAMGLSYLVVEKLANVGDTWLERYDSLKLHTSKTYNQLPGNPRVWRPEDPYHLNTPTIASGFRRYVNTFGIKVSTSTTVTSGRYDRSSESWILDVQKDGEVLQIEAKHVILAVGNQGMIPKEIPSYPNRDRFRGDIIHGASWKNALPWAGKSGIVVGSANTAHGVISDMANAGFKSITVIQRSPTFVLPWFTFSFLLDPIWNEETPVEVGDRMAFAYPVPVNRLVTLIGTRLSADAHAEYFDRLEAGGFNVDRYGDLIGAIYDREGGHFFDTGAGEHIANGTVKVRSDALPISYTETGLELSDGSKLDADVIVFTVGYERSMRATATKLFGEEVGSSIDEFWSSNKEGESRGAWTHVGQDRLWYTGHGFAPARFYSRFVAMHIKADVEGRPMEMYLDTPNLERPKSITDS